MRYFWHDEIALFSRCIERFPDSGFCHNRVGMALQGVGDLKGAEQELATAFKLDPGDYATEYDLAMVHEQRGYHRQTAQEADDALKHLPNAPARAYVTLGQIYDAAGAAGASEAAFAQAEKLPNGASEVALAQARIKLGHNDTEGAEQQLRSYLATAPDDPVALMLLGSALAIQARYADALGAYQHALAGAPRSTRIRFLVALDIAQSRPQPGGIDAMPAGIGGSAFKSQCGGAYAHDRT